MLVHQRVMELMELHYPIDLETISIHKKNILLANWYNGIGWGVIFMAQWSNIGENFPLVIKGDTWKSCVFNGCFTGNIIQKNECFSVATFDHWRVSSN